MMNLHFWSVLLRQSFPAESAKFSDAMLLFVRTVSGQADESTEEVLRLIVVFTG